MIDSEGYRHNVGIIISNQQGQLLWARRIGQDAWQFPQGGINESETLEGALFRELSEEVGLNSEHVEIIGCTKDWLHYRLPEHLMRYKSLPLCIGQKQMWFLLRLTADDQSICFDKSSRPEFDSWKWVDYWYPLKEVIAFKRKVYERALEELKPLLFPDGAPTQHRRRRGPRGYRR
ncbi:MAG: RNA pyrophosphohydrolase [Gammaproteobacteria bacterium]|nr:RNA pyrophosphohydrolase [Gammaproteobacteria bacterium]